MKITSLQFKNLNSLKGEFKIDFTKPELANAGLFAITGPTGAGKSTILDAITLALYSYAPRIGAITKSTIVDKGVVVTKHTKDAFAHIIFEINNKIYKAEWGIAINNRGNWGEITHKVSMEEEGQFVPLSVNKSDAYNQIKKIVGLDEDQFTKAIVLSQGKFDEFLKAKKDERYALLEIITGTQIYREIGKKVYQSLVEVNAKAEALKNQMGGIVLLTDDEIKEIKEKKKRIDQKITDLGNHIKKFEKVKTNKETIINLEKQREEIESEFTELEKNINEFKQDNLKLEQHEKALPLQVLHNNWSNTAKDINLLQSAIEENSTTLDGEKINKDKQIEKLSAICKTKIDTDNFLPKLREFSSKVSDLDTQIASEENSLKLQGKNLEGLFYQVPRSNSTELQEIKFSVPELETYFQNSKRAVDKIKLPSDFNGINYDDYMQSLNTKLQLLNNAKLIRKEIVNKQKRIEAFDAELSKIEEQKSDLNIQVEALNQETSETNSEFEKLKSAADAFAAIKGLESYRNALEEGKPCPCCGSETHPYAQNKPETDNTIDASVVKVQNKIIEQAAAIRKIEDALLSLRTIKDNTIANKENVEKELNEQISSFNVCCTDLNIDINSTGEVLNELLSSIDETISNVKVHKEWNETKQSLLKYIDEFKAYLIEKEKLNEKKKERTELFGKDAIQDFQNGMILEWNGILKDIENSEKRILESRNSLAEKQKHYDQLNKELNEKIKIAGFNTVLDLESVLLKEEDYKIIKKNKDQLQSNKVAILAKQETNQKSLQEAKKVDDPTIVMDQLIKNIVELVAARDATLNEQGQLHNQIDANEESKQRVAGIAAELEIIKTRQKYHSILAGLIGDQSGNKFNNIIQRITLRHLFDMTNQRLAGLMERYQVDLGGEGLEDEIWVIDTYMGDEKRTINSVSGGERFVISLAMALSLSDLASNNVRIDSMFIDEGFGNLSPDDLDNAMNMLERLQVENEKTIGLISHVESMKERISTQIQVVKLQNGESTLYLRSNGLLTELR